MIINWNEYFMGVAIMSAYRSKDPNTQVGTCIVNEDNRIVAVGYNGMPYGCNDDSFPWSRDGAYLEQKYPYVVHAELNAILNSTSQLKNCTLYTMLFPCNECCKAIIQSGIMKIYYLCDKYKDTEPIIASKRMLDAAHIKYTQMNTKLKKLEISYLTDNFLSYR